jgi:hypothetical protein
MIQHRPSAGEQELEVVTGQVLDQAVVDLEDGGVVVALALMERADLLSVVAKPI